ncbi:MAG: polyprenyl synthetase family protein [Myxococcota bacterium]|nr:polyprenyl synthetase family protein [Myxococcota bacterium]
MDALGYLSERAELADAALERALPPADAPPAALHAAMRHLVFPGGKRLRPALAFAGAEAVGAPPERALPAAVAVELLHTYSLIHDDLPCMDDDALRRGRPTVHVAFGESTAVLAGNALQTAAFEALVQPSGQHSPERLLAAARTLTRAVGSLGLIGGQVDDLAMAPGAASAEAVESVHLRKTAALIDAAVVAGALLGGADATGLERLNRYGLSVGLAFQIADDLIDRDDGEACSLVAALGADAARRRAASLVGEAQAALDAFGPAAEPLRELARFAVWRDR